ncbi:nucleoside-diphosphate-sugar epimerase [Mumia flava]|uniref:Nucleoside-diphosphate-sugar epimerase n=1 Tax=Mumia flava TaxID=1348852 RepID=A0A2M9BGP0_9ACTN|nr:nucleoside-diphosphate-sugar epimerase [Mumia flava]
MLGGTHHVGRAVVEAALSRGDDVTTVTRGTSGPPAVGATARTADRTVAGSLEAALRGERWDAVIDTWSGAPSVVRTSARLLADRAGWYGYVSSRSVYAWPIPSGADETAPVVAGDPDDTREEDYAAAKRGGELAALDSFGDRALLARAGLILGPYEYVGRLPWWLERIARGGPTLAPGPPDRPLQYVDARDLAAWMLDEADRGAGGAVDTVSPPGHSTIGELLEACVAVTGSGAELRWSPPDVLADAGISGWTDLPVWVPPTGELASLHDGDTALAASRGLRCRPAPETVTDTWAWLRTEGMPTWTGRSPVGLAPETEAAVLARLRD